MATNPFVIYRASAGAGKTHALVREYLTMAFSLGPDRLAEGFRTILAITFTNKAAAEMKERIMDELANMAAAPAVPGDDTMAADVYKGLHELGIKVSPEQLQRMAQSLRTTILHHYSDLSVSTIDSFMHRIVRTFAHDFGQPMNFDVMIDQQKIIDQAVASLMSLAGTAGNDPITNLLIDFAENNMEQGNGYNIEASLKGLAKQLFKEDIGEHLGLLDTISLDTFKKIHDTYYEEVHQFKTSVQGSASKLLSLLGGIDVDISNAFYGKQGYYSYLTNLAAGQMAPLSARTVEAFEKGKYVSPKASPSLRAAVDGISPQLDTEYNNLKTKLDDGLLRYNTLRVLLGNLYSTALLRYLDSEIHRYTQENDLVHIADFNRLINAVVQDQDNPAPFIYERLGNRYRHFLIDEFQDTSRMQWHNMVPLLENGVSQGHKSIVVGDSKQFIYRFRQGDVTQFVKLPRVEGMKHHGHTLSIPGNYKIEGIGNNRRSTSNIVDFNNELFSWLARNVYTDNPYVQDVYIGRDANGDLMPPGKELLRQEKFNPKAGHVEVNFVADADAQEAGFANVKDAIYDAIVRTIENLVQRQKRKYSEIVVLARNNATLAEIGTYMSQHSDIPQTSTESFHLNESHAVMAVVAALRLLHNNADRTARADLDYRLHTLFGDRAPLSDSRSLGTGSHSTLYDTCEHLIRTLHLKDFDTLHLASFLDRVASFSARHRQNVGDFLEWFDEQDKLSAASPEDIDAVQLLTIHKAKGLGKEIVICPLFYGKDFRAEIWVDNSRHDTETDTTTEDMPPAELPTAYVSLPAGDATLYDRQRRHEQLLYEVDELNILYVAFTRAKEHLYVFSPDPADIKKPRANDHRNPMLLYRFMTDVHWTETPETPVLTPPDDKKKDKDNEKDKDKKEEQVKTVTVDTLNSNNWPKRVAIASPSEKALTPLVESKIRFGNYAHDLLATVLHADDVERAIAIFADSHQLQDDEQEQLATLARRVVVHPDARRFFDPSYKVKNECDLVIDGVKRRPDRIVFTPDQTWVVDFKTGAHIDRYETQVREYCDAVAAMGYPNVSGWLLYLQPDIALRQIV